MLVRTVQMTFKTDAIDDFLAVYDRSAPQIRDVEGCLHLELWEDSRYPGILTTHSRWKSEEALEAYRESDLFRNAWSAAKSLFAAPPRASSHMLKRPACP
jgi:quinol monooxygenase YgiN